MIRITVLYPTKKGSRFDWDYYVNKHIPLVKRRIGNVIQNLHVDKGLGSAEPGAPAPFQIVAQFTCKTVEDFQKAMKTHGRELMADIPNYTDIQPVFQISEIAVS